MAAELTFAELCKAFDVSQEELANILGVKQTNVSKVERREDMRLSTLVTYVRAIGGDIEIIAQFPNRGGGKDKTIKLKPFVEGTADAA
jgi:transcriptional regulator with XRE-family HTH domain